MTHDRERRVRALASRNSPVSRTLKWESAKGRKRKKVRESERERRRQRRSSSFVSLVRASRFPFFFLSQPPQPAQLPVLYHFARARPSLSLHTVSSFLCSCLSSSLHSTSDYHLYFLMLWIVLCYKCFIFNIFTYFSYIVLQTLVFHTCDLLMTRDFKPLKLTLDFIM